MTVKSCSLCKSSWNTIL